MLKVTTKLVNVKSTNSNSSNKQENNNNSNNYFYCPNRKKTKLNKIYTVITRTRTKTNTTPTATLLKTTTTTTTTTKAISTTSSATLAQSSTTTTSSSTTLPSHPPPETFKTILLSSQSKRTEEKSNNSNNNSWHWLNSIIKKLYCGASTCSSGSNSSSNSCHQNNIISHSRQQTISAQYFGNMLVFIIIILIVNACIAGTIPATPENITVTFLTPTTVRVSWQTMIDLNAHPVEKYIVTYKPADDRVMQDVAGNSEAIILDRLSPGTQYSLVVTAVWLGKKYRSRPIIIRTLDLPKPLSQQDLNNGAASSGTAGAGIAATSNGLGNFAGRTTAGSNSTAAFGEDGVTSTATNSLSHGTHRELPTIRGVEIGIVLIVLMVWAGAIALFFNRWGKIRMLLPYQPDYKHEQLKVPGTGVCSGGVCNGQHSHQFDSSECGALAAYQPLHCSREEHSASISERITRSRINSAIFVSSEGRGFDSIEFLRRHGSQSVLCRKAKSAENITDNERKKSFAEKRQWHTDDPDGNAQSDGDNIELQECSRSVENHPVAILKQNVEKLLAATSVLGHSAAVTTSNKVVGSISIETPPSHIREEELQRQQTVILQPPPLPPPPPPPPLSWAKTLSLNSASHDSADTVEELISIPLDTAATATVTASKLISAIPPPPSVISSKPRVLVHQRSSTISPIPMTTTTATSTTTTTAHSPKKLKLKCITPKLNNLPMVSVSGPSPPDEKPPTGSDCL